MTRLTAFVVTAALSSAGAATSAPVEVSPQCRTVRLTEDGRRIEAPAKSGVGSPARTGAAAAARASAVGASSRSSVSASSSSRGARFSAVATSTTTDADGRTITITHDSKGCTVVVDERELYGDQR